MIEVDGSLYLERERERESIRKAFFMEFLRIVYPTAHVHNTETTAMESHGPSALETGPK